jgi:hypoxanthine-DNA glycosylase
MMLESKSFAPIVDDNSKILILGSLPGAESLRRQQYYAHPQNRFWKVIATIGERGETYDYAERISMLKNLCLALWDVAASAVRKGSLDSDIKDEIPNDIPSLIAEYPNIKTVIFNGRKAEAMYDKYFDRIDGVRYVYLPSTSPANAGFGFQALNEKWTEAIRL